MKTVTVKGKSLKGKNRVREHGETWKVISEQPNKILIESLKNPNNCRWIDFKNDSDMEIISINLES